MPSFEGRHPTAFPQERLKINFVDSVTTSDALQTLLDALLEPLPEERIDAEEAMALLRSESVTVRSAGTSFGYTFAEGATKREVS